MHFKGTVHRYGRDIDTDVIIPARYLTTSEPSELAKHCLEDLDVEFVNKVKPGDIIVAEEIFGCGSSREHAPIAIKAAGVDAVIAKSFARIHRANLMNNGILPLEFTDEADYDAIAPDDEIVIENAPAQIAAAAEGECVNVRAGGRELKMKLVITPRQRDILLAGGLLNYTKAHRED